MNYVSIQKKFQEVKQNLDTKYIIWQKKAYILDKKVEKSKVDIMEKNKW